MNDILDEITSLENMVSSLNEKISHTGGEIFSVVEKIASTLTLLRRLIGLLDLLFIPVTITILCIQTLNVGLVLYFLEKPSHDSHVMGIINEGEMYNRKGKKRECKINIQYSVKDVTYDYTFTETGKSNYINKDKICIYYNSREPQTPSLKVKKPIRGIIICCSSIFVTFAGWMGWWYIS